MKRLITLILIIISQIGFGQSKKISIELVVSPDYYTSSYKQANVDFPDQKFSSKLNFSLGAKSSYHFNSQLALGIGINYAQKAYQLAYNYHFLDENDPFIEKKTDFYLAYLEFPVSLRYNFVNNNKFSFLTSIGVMPGILLDKQQTTTFEDEHSQRGELLKTNPSTTLLASTLSLGAVYRITSRLGILFEPEYRFYFQQIDKVAFKMNPMQVSLKVGTVFNF